MTTGHPVAGMVTPFGTVSDAHTCSVRLATSGPLPALSILPSGGLEYGAAPAWKTGNETRACSSSNAGSGVALQARSPVASGQGEAPAPHLTHELTLGGAAAEM